MPTAEDRESDSINRVVEVSQRLLDLQRRPVPRDQHPKQHGCVRAKFVVKEKLSEDQNINTSLKVGLFKEPGVYDAWIRFSNGAQRDDRKPDVHGMAIKLMDVPGPKAILAELNDAEKSTQDFVMVDHPTFFIKDAREYALFSEALLRARGKAPSGIRDILSYLLPDRICTSAYLLLTYFLPWRLGTMRRMRQFISKRIANPLTTRYWSTTAYRFGEGDVSTKFSAVPVVLPEGTTPRPESDFENLSGFLDEYVKLEEPYRARPLGRENETNLTEDYLRAAMAKSLEPQGNGAVFRFQVQKANESSSTPSDDPTVEWLESDVPFHTVAYIWIPPQEFESEARMAFGENLSMSPWHALKAHEPVGEINEIRRPVYEQLSTDRHEANQVDRIEPHRNDGPLSSDTASQGLAAWGNDPSSFAAVLSEEHKLIKHRREKVTADEPTAILGQPLPKTIQEGDEDGRIARLRVRALRSQVTGLSISGGGIRSGTFAVGFLQGLASLGLIRRLDYLSTVSGGGYAGAWLAAWLRREGGDPANVELMLSPSRITQAKAARQLLQRGEVVDEEPEPLRHLRAYSRYLFPVRGILSADTWTVILIWLRNVTINLMMLFPAIMLLVVASRLAVNFYRFFNPLSIETSTWFLVITVLALILGLVFGATAYFNNSRALRSIRDSNNHDSAMSAIGSPSDVQALVSKGVINPMTIAALLLTASVRAIFWIGADVATTLRQPAARLDTVSIPSMLEDAFFSHLGLLEFPAFLVAAIVFGLPLACVAWLGARGESSARRVRFFKAALMAGATGGVLLVLLAGLIRGFARMESADLMATFATPLAILVVVASLIVLVALLGRTINEAEREWWARLSALGTLRALSWIGVMAAILYVPGLLIASGPWLRTAFASGWLGTAIFGVLTGRFVLPRAGRRSALPLTTLAAWAASFFLAGLVGLVAWLASVLANNPSLLLPSRDDLTPFGYYIRGVNGTPTPTLLLISAIALILYSLARDLIDVNLFSLNAMYANRLTRCYLGASRAMSTWPDRWRLPRDLRADAGAPSLSHDAPVRQPNPVTGLDPVGDDLNLSDLRIGTPDQAAREYLGPHLLINTTLNLVGESSLVRQDRKGESFILSPLYCGSKSVGYSKLKPLEEEEQVESNLTLGRAIAISGAAVDPNMSFYQSAPLTALLTLFDARLGYWIEKPRAIGWKARSATLGDLIFTEFFGRTDQRGEFVHISDGGHFENLGVYELIRRRCRYIVALDAGEDGDPSNTNLANLIRLCRIDFGIRIKIDTRPLTMTGPDRLTRTHVVIGTVHYDDVDHGEMPGVLVYVKISLTGDEAPDVQKYARADPRFPHQPTDLRQSFDEEQFECYRCLGDHIAWDVFGDPVGALNEELRSQDVVPKELPHGQYIPRLFAAVQERWTEAPEALSELYVQANQAWSEIQRDLSRISTLERLSQDLYPELKSSSSEEEGASSRVELHTVARMLALMENSWIALSLKRTSALPMNRGWVNSFRRWVATSAFRKAWPILRSEYSSDFVRFCEEQLHLTAAKLSPVRLSSSYDKLEEKDPNRVAIDILDEEFAREWPAEHRKGRGIIALVSRAADGAGGPLAWLLVQSPNGPEQAKDSADRFGCGVILAVRSPAPKELKTKSEGQLEPVELFIWVRRAYRSAGLGTSGLLHTLPVIREELRSGGVAPLLWASYPKTVAADDELEFANYLRFLSFHDFRPSKDPKVQNRGHSYFYSSNPGE